MTQSKISQINLTVYQQAKLEQNYALALDYLIETISNLHLLNEMELFGLIAPLNEAQTELEQLWVEGHLAYLEPKYYLFQAEMARLESQNWSAMQLYDQAIETAKVSGQIQNQAMAHELTAEFWFAQAKQAFAIIHLKKGCDLYSQIGDKQKAANLALKFPELGRSQETNSTQPIEALPDTLDLESSLEAWRMISGEMVLSKLLQKLIHVVLEQSGADKGCLIFDKNSAWVIEAQGFKDSSVGPEILQSIPADSENGLARLPLSILNYVAENQANVIIADMTPTSPFGHDKYFVTHPVRSLLCMPFIHEIKGTGMLYLENSTVAGAFTSTRLESLKLLSSQAAISIETAILYSSLEAALKNQAELTTAYSRFVPREIIEFLGKDNIAQVQLGDQTQQDMTVLFSDIRAFSTLSEQMTPQENFNFINDYLGRVSPIIRTHQGFIDKYIGDAVMALFPGETDNAILAAIAMQEEVGRYNIHRHQKGHQSIKIGIGLHLGSVMLGTIGEAKRMEGTVISDAVNLASRLEGLTKLYGAPIVVSEQTLFSLKNPSSYNFRFLDKVKVKGKQIKVSVFEIFDGSSEEIVELKLRTRTDFEKGLFHYHSQEFREAIECFNNVLELNPKDRAAQVYLRQATHCLWIGWESVKVLTEK